MWKVVARLHLNKWIGRKTLLLMGVAGIAAGAFFCGRQVALSQTRGAGGREEQVIGTYTPASTNQGDLGKRVVAHVNGNIPLTREDFGEYLIARFGEDRVDAFINRRILEIECHKRGVYVTDVEVKAQLDEELKSLGTGITEKDFTNQILKRFNKTLFEWKEDVIRPRLALSKIVHPTINVAYEDLQKGFEARYGEKVKCRMIVLDKNDNRWTQLHEKIRSSEAEFARAAREQFIAALAAEGGQVPPIHRHFGDPRIEKEAFMLKPGEVSSVFGMPDGTRVILKCDGHIPADTSVRFEVERTRLHTEIVQLRLNQKIQEVFKELRDQANVKNYLKRDLRQDDLERAVRKELNPGASEVKPASNQVPAYSPPAAVVPPMLYPAVDPSKLQGPPPGSITDVSKLPDPKIAPPGQPVPEGPPSTSFVIPVSNESPEPSSVLNPSPTTGLPRPK